MSERLFLVKVLAQNLLSRPLISTIVRCLIDVVVRDWMVGQRDVPC